MSKDKKEMHDELIEKAALEGAGVAIYPDGIMIVLNRSTVESMLETMDLHGKDHATLGILNEDAVNDEGLN